jgi:hypothetical protein
MPGILLNHCDDSLGAVYYLGERYCVRTVGDPIGERDSLLKKNGTLENEVIFLPEKVIT